MRKLGEILNEGSWGYEPDQNDGTLDLRGDIFFAICELVYDKCSDLGDTSIAWEELGAIEFFFEQFSKIEDFGLGDEKFDQYYYWWRLMDKKKTKNIVALYERLLNMCKKDEKWINDWKEPDKMRKSLEDREEVLNKWKKLLSDRTEHEKELAKKRNTMKQAEVTTDTVEVVDPECIKESVNDLNNWPNVTTLGDGEYDGALWGHCFVYEGQKYYSECGWRNIFPSYCKMVIENGKAWAHQVDEYQRPKLKELFN